jgi:hypothetical protein
MLFPEDTKKKRRKMSTITLFTPPLDEVNNPAPYIQVLAS